MPVGGLDGPMGLMVDRDDLDHLCVSAAGYAIGRGTYATDGVLDVLEANWDALDDGAREPIRVLVREYARRGWLAGDSARRWRALANRSDPLGSGSDPVVLRSGWGVDLNILFFSAFRHDMQSDDPDVPVLWVRFARDYASVVMRANWAYCTARDLLWEHLVPLDEPYAGLQGPLGRVAPADGRWRAFYRLMYGAGVGRAAR